MDGTKTKRQKVLVRRRDLDERSESVNADDFRALRGLDSLPIQDSIPTPSARKVDRRSGHQTNKWKV